MVDVSAEIGAKASEQKRLLQQVQEISAQIRSLDAAESRPPADLGVNVVDVMGMAERIG